MLHRKIIAVYSEIRTKHVNAFCGRNVQFVMLMLPHVIKALTWRFCHNFSSS